jgi:formylglycine-generating enzyme required for sulfatase activity
MRKNKLHVQLTRSHKLLLIAAMVLFMIPVSSEANNLIIGSPVVTQNATTGGTVKFTISWNNAWNVSSVSAPFNWDAVWITVWFKPCSATAATAYTHGTLSSTLASHTIPASLQAMASVNANGTANSYAGFITESVPMSTLGANLDFTDGIMLSPTASGVANLTTCTVTLSISNLPANTIPITTEVFGLEMVYVPEGSTTSLMVGDGTGTGAAASNSFVSSGVYSATPTALQLGTANETATSTFYITNEPAAGNVQTINNVPAAFPKGIYGFYTMKHEITEGNYATFLNMLGTAQQTTRLLGALANRNQLTQVAAPFSTTRPWRAQNWLSWGDISAFLAWDCLRPVTELEYEKACRGPGTTTVLLGYPWGSTTITQATTFAAPAVENGSEVVLVGSPSGDCVYGNTAWTNGDAGLGPARTGMFAQANTSQTDAGASYFGVLDLAGNVQEWVVAVSSTNVNPGSGANNIFTRQWGNGTLNASGDQSNASFTSGASTWPAPNLAMTATSVTNLVGCKGGSWLSPVGPPCVQCEVSDRSQIYTFGAVANEDVAGARANINGGRGGR